MQQPPAPRESTPTSTFRKMCGSQSLFTPRYLESNRRAVTSSTPNSISTTKARSASQWLPPTVGNPPVALCLPSTT